MNRKDLLTLQAAIKAVGQVRLLSAPYPGLANLIESATQILNGEGGAETIVSGRRLAEVKALLLMAHDEIHTEDPHPEVNHRLN